ncbi:HNH endonuclease signature motif containing protein [Nocardioides ungokensis]|uniref:HNH endonuclease signature motif containing protein n=1 Tax=Nocardioides ungokensis TaxID=1643322 RepID=UPI0015DF0B91|nr:HNH endonuclease signature motif containing protein [Nocardioides ungokensis]
MEPYKARHVAQATHRLSRDAAAYVDEQLAPGSPRAAGRRSRPPSPTRSPSTTPSSRSGEAGKQSWHVTLRHPAPSEYAGTSWLDITGDTLDLTAFHDLVCDHAAALKALGDTTSWRSARPRPGRHRAQQAQLDLTTLWLRHRGDAAARAATPKTRFYLHLNLADLATHGAAPGDLAAGTVERLGAATITHQGVGRPLPGHRPAGPRPRPHRRVDGTNPAWMRELVILRDGHCVFPWCPHDARSADLDHIDPYVPIDEGGPPGQTHPGNLAPLCRRHHRAKTSRRWRYRRRPDSTYEWHGPHGRAYLVTPHGTIQLTSN